MPNLETRTRILQMITEHSGVKIDKIDPRDILGSTGMAGDDGDEFFEAFAEEFNVDFLEFCNYLHYDPNEPPGGRLLRIRSIRPDGTAIGELPISLDDLCRAAENKKWTFEYPKHEIVQTFFALHYPMSVIVFFIFSLGTLFFIKSLK